MCDGEKLYRVTDTYVTDEYNEEVLFGSTKIQLRMESYNVIKRTPCGAWIKVYGEKKFVNLTCRKQYAYESKEKAMQSFMCRKNRQIKILSAQLNKAEMALSQIKAAIEKNVALEEFKSMYQFAFGDDY